MYDFAVDIINITNSKSKVIPLSSDEIKNKTTRPSFSALDKTKFKKTFEIKIEDYFTSLKKCLKKFKMRNILVTGGCGFIGINFIDHFLSKYPDYKIYNLDNLTYAANKVFLPSMVGNANYKFIEGDICNYSLVKQLFIENKISHVINFAAESHVDNSISSP